MNNEDKDRGYYRYDEVATHILRFRLHNGDDVDVGICHEPTFIEMSEVKFQFVGYSVYDEIAQVAWADLIGRAMTLDEMRSEDLYDLVEECGIDTACIPFDEPFDSDSIHCIKDDINKPDCADQIFKWARKFGKSTYEIRGNHGLLEE